MKVKLEWIEFVDGALRDLGQNYRVNGEPEFFAPYEPDSQCYSFPPAYVEIEVSNEP